jgi:hypothetical protein
MAASVQIHRLTGSGPTATNVTAGSSRYSASDDPSPGSSNPVPIPSAGLNHSFWVVMRLNAISAPTGVINNIKWFTSGTNPWTGATLEVATATAYTQATGSTGVTGNTLNTVNYPTLSSTPVSDNAFTYDSGTPLTVDGSLTGPATGYFGDFVVSQFSLAATATPGVLSSEIITFQWDET